MKNIEVLKNLIIEQLEEIHDEDLLDLILQLLIAEGRQQSVDIGKLAVG